MDAPLKFSRQAAAQLQPEGLSEEAITISDVIEQVTGFIRREHPIFVFVIGCCLALGLVYLFTTPPSFTSHAMLLIDSSKLRFLQEKQIPLADVPIDEAQVDTQVEILKSENIGLSVIKELKLTADPEFVGSSSGLFGWITGRLSLEGAEPETKLERRALGKFLDRRSVSRVARTYVLDIGFTSLNGGRSAAIANAIADAYIVDQLEAKYQATKRASVWLQDRIKELRSQATEADRAVLDYKEQNKIVSVGGSSPGGPRLLGEQQLEDLNTQLGAARAAAEETKARLERISDVMQRDVPDASVADSLKSEVINRLRNNYLDIAAKEAIWSARYGPDHLAAVNLRTQMAELRRAIHDELGRIGESYKSDYEISKTRVEGLERELQRLVASSQVTNRDKLGLSDLESTAKVYHSIYDNFLQRYMEAIQQQSFPITEARVISLAAPPEGKSSPKTLTVLGIAGFIGVVLSFGAAVLREAIDQVFRTARDVEHVLQVNCLAVLPRLGSATDIKAFPAIGSFSLRSMLATAPSKRGIQNAGSNRASDVHASPLSWESGKRIGSLAHEAAITERNLSFSSSAWLREVVDQPLSGFAEAFRSIKIAADIGGADRHQKVIGVTSTVPGEGKSTVASNLAELIAHSGKRVILLDGDLRNPTLSRALKPDSKMGLLEVLNDRLSIGDVVCFDEETGLSFVPTRLKSRLVHTNEILASDRFSELVASLREVYDYVVIDLPPLAPVVDVRAAAKVIDAYVYVVEWGKTRKNFVQNQLSNAPEVYDLLLGVVLNKADIRVLGRYEDYGSYYGKTYYGSYGYSG